MYPLLGDLLLGRTRATADQHVEGNGVGALAALLGDDVARLLALGQQLETLEATAGPVQQATGRADGDLGLRATVLLVAEALGQAAVASAGAEIDGAKDGRRTDVVPVGVLWGTLAAVGGLDNLRAAGDKELALLLELLGRGLDPLPRANVADGGALALAHVADALCSLGRNHDDNLFNSSSLEDKENQLMNEGIHAKIKRNVSFGLTNFFTRKLT